MVYSLFAYFKRNYIIYFSVKKNINQSLKGIGKQLEAKRDPWFRFYGLLYEERLLTTLVKKAMS